MTNTEIDFQLARAIGYATSRVSIPDFWSNGQLITGVHVLNNKERGDGPQQWSHWQRFDHTDPAVIWPIAERFDALPNRWRKGECVASIGTSLLGSKVHPIAATATALAVIQYCKKGKPATQPQGNPS